MIFKPRAIVLVFAATLTTTLASAKIEGSSYEGRHQTVIELAVYEKCGLSGHMTEISSSQIENRVDNGITDIFYKTTVLVRSRIDQNIFENFLVHVESLYSDHYDHTAQDWGAYSVLSVSSLDHFCSN